MGSFAKLASLAGSAYRHDKKQGNMMLLQKNGLITLGISASILFIGILRTSMGF